MNDKCSETNRIMQTFISVFAFLASYLPYLFVISLFISNFGRQ